MLRHLTGDNEVISVLGRAVKKVGLGELSGEGQRGERVHYHVHPEELNGLEGRLLEEDGAKHGEEESVHVHGKLELEETLDVIVNVSSPGAGLDDRGERVILDNDVSSSEAHSSTCQTHAESDIGLRKGGGIVGSVTSDGDNLPAVHQTRHEQVLVLGARTSHHLQLGHVSLEKIHVSDLFPTVLSLTLTISGAVFFTGSADESTH